VFVDKILTEIDILRLVSQDEWMMSVLSVAKKVNLPDWMIGAGFIRNKVWDELHGFDYSKRRPEDLDLIYFDLGNTSKSQEEKYNIQLNNILKYNWSVKNMARMHEHNNDEPYVSTLDGLAHWVETATCIAVKLNEANKPIIIAPYGIDDLVNLILKPTLHMKYRMEDFEARVTKKQWLLKWPKLKVVK
jgi:hypothetical protein